MSPRAATLLALLTIASACHRRTRARRARARFTSAPHSLLQVAPPEGSAWSLGSGRFVVGSIRIDGAMRAAPPYPLTELVGCERVGARWRFFTRDGSGFEADSFVGPLRLVEGARGDADVSAPQGFRCAEGDASEAESELLRRLPLHERAPLPLPAEPWEAAARTHGELDVLRGDEVVRYDPRTLAVVSRHEAPGSACTLHRAWLGTRAVCTHGGWARAVFAEERGWTAIRDELHAEPSGDLAFDDRSPLWAVGAACAEAPVPQGNRACVYTPDGRRHDLALPFDGVPVAAHAGAVLFVEAMRESPRTAGAIWRGGRLTPLTLPVPPTSARSLQWRGDALLIADGAAVARVWLRDDRVRAHDRITAPPGAMRVVLGERGSFAIGRERAWRLVGARFVPQPIALQGRRDARDLAAGQGFCVGPWCRLSDALWWSAEGIRPMPAIASDRAPSSPPAGARGMSP